jgi:hypothetical protein
MHSTRKWCAGAHVAAGPALWAVSGLCSSCAHLEHRGCGGRPTGAAETTRLGGDGWASAESRLSLLTCCRVRSETPPAPPARMHSPGSAAAAVKEKWGSVDRCIEAGQ